MFGSTSQNTGGGLFGAGSAPTTNATPALNFGNTNNTANNTNGTTSGFSFGNNTTTASKPSGFSFGTGNTTAPATNSLFGNNTAQSTTTAPQTSLFGNSSTNPSFGNTASGLGVPQNGQTSMFQQAQNNDPEQAKFLAAEMPKSLTSAPSEDLIRVKRKRSSSNVSINSKSEDVNSTNGRNLDTYKRPSKYSLESMRGLFTSNGGKIQSSKKTDTKVDSYSQSLGLDISRIPSSQSEYKRLIIRNSKDAFSKFDDIDANKVLLSKKANYKFDTIPTAPPKQTSSGLKQFITSLKPASKRANTRSTDDKVELTFSKPITEQLYDESTMNLTTDQVKVETEYWCSPSIEELSKMTSLELTHVENFSAGRKSYGNLMFRFPVDLTAFEGRWESLLGSSIVFHKKTLQVYPDDANKPRQGNGLNIPAVITLENVFPPRYDPSNPDTKLLESHIQRLKTAHGMKFISFDPISGNYVFEVEHFSIWGIVDEEDDEPELVAKWQKQQQSEYLNEKRKTDLQIQTLEKITGYGHPGDNWKKQKPDLSMNAPGALQFEDDQNIEEEEENDLTEDFEVQDSPADVVSKQIISIPDEDNHDAKKLALINANVPGIDELVEVRAYEPEVKDVDMDFINTKTELSVADNWDDQLKLSNGFFSVFNKNLNGRYNVPLDPQSVGDFIFKGIDTAKLTKAVVETPLNFEYSESYQRCLKAEIFEAKFNKRSTGLSQILLNQTVDLRIPLTSFENTENSNIWELFAIIYDEEFLLSFIDKHTLDVCANTPEKIEYILELKQRELLCCYLQKLVSSNADQIEFEQSISKDHTVDRIYQFICNGNVTDAIQYAINTKNNHLAVLLTVIGSDDSTVRDIAKSQLDEWKKGAGNFIPSGVMKVYKLLMGDILSKEYIDHLEGLSWPMVLFLMIKYGDSRKSLKDTIIEFIHYAENSGIDKSPIYQIYFSLFKLIGKTSDVLHTFEVELQFLMMKNLNSVLSFDDEQFDEVVKQFAHNLERADMIEEAIFVLEHLVDDTDNEQLVTSILHNNVNKLEFLEDNDKLNKLHQLYDIPKSVLYESRSVEFKNRNEYESSVLQLILAEKLEAGHEMLLANVAPKLIIVGSEYKLRRLEELAKKFETLAEYNIGAGVYEDYISFTKVSKGIDYKADDFEEKRDTLRTNFEGLVNGVSNLEEYNDDVKIAKTLMQKELIKVMFKQDLQCDPSILMRLELPESEKNYLEAKIIRNSDDKMITN